MHTKFWLENLKRPHGRARHRWEGNIKTDIREICLQCGFNETSSEMSPVAGSCVSNGEIMGSVWATSAVCKKCFTLLLFSFHSLDKCYLLW